MVNPPATRERMHSVERLQKILSQAGVASRRSSEQLMIEGRVTVNGTTVRELGTKADPAIDDIRVDGRRIKLAERHRYILLHKPRNYMTTRHDPQKRATVLDLLGGVREYVYPVGRLDYDSEGLLLLTNDGDLAARLTHPSHGVERVYEAVVLGVPDSHDIERLSRGVTIDGRRTEQAVIKMLPHREGGHARLQITIREGRNRQVRNMFDAVGHPVDTLERVAIGPLRDTRLKSGHWRDLTGAEVASLKRAASQTAASRTATSASRHQPGAKPGSRTPKGVTSRRGRSGATSPARDPRDSNASAARARPRRGR